ncbi:MAG: DAK2 domain-containing protein, partial [Acidimicrobiales bacterium]
MDQAQPLTAAQLGAAMVAYRDRLREHRETLNRLNVYPVPDGDTGTNMALTMDSVVEALAALSPSPVGAGELPAASMRDLCETMGHASLMGARGNSGVILSQLLRGMADSLASAGVSSVAVIGGAELAEALGAAAESARRAVQRPVEG